MQLSVVILNYNVRYFLELCLASVIQALEKIDSEIIVVDNNSSDDSCEMVRRRFPQVKLIANTENSGFPKGNNIGVAQAKGKYICILNPDTVVSTDTFQKVLNFILRKQNPGVVGVKLIDGAGNFLPESKRGVPTPFVAFTRISNLFRLSPKWFGKYYAQHLSPDGAGEVEILVGAFMLMERALYLELGGFDENCFMYSDDIDLSYMVLKSGRKNYYFGQTTVIHYKGESTLRDAKYMKRFREAMDFFYRKHFRRSVLLDVFLRGGTFLFALAKKNRPVSRERNIDRYVLKSENPSLKARLESTIGVDFGSDLPPDNVNREIFFDAAGMAFSEIILDFERHRSTATTFKIVDPEHRFALGSNSATDRGKVILLADHRSDIADNL